MKYNIIDRFSVLFCSLLFLWVFLNNYASSHSLGMVLKERSGDYFVEVGANTFELVEDELIVFNLELLKADESGSEEFTNVRVNIIESGKAILSANVIRPEIGDAVFGYKFSDGGKYDLKVSYEKGDNMLAEKTFTLEVGTKDDGWNELKPVFMAGVTGVAIGFFLALAFKKKGSA